MSPPRKLDTSELGPIKIDPTALGLTDGQRLIGDLQAERHMAAFTRDRIGQPGCEVRKDAARVVEAFDIVLDWLHERERIRNSTPAGGKN